MNSKNLFHHHEVKGSVAFQEKYRSDNGTKSTLSQFFESSVSVFQVTKADSFYSLHDLSLLPISSFIWCLYGLRPRRIEHATLVRQPKTFTFTNSRKTGNLWPSSQESFWSHLSFRQFSTCTVEPFTFSRRTWSVRKVLHHWGITPVISSWLQDSVSCCF